uniref:Ig-like domain-containing protein n=1 Tax=Esox lucius TaxID=8010 RepID=A0A6Q2ZN18_ESOLU
MLPKLCLVILYHLDGLFPFTGLSQTDQVHQTPTAILKQPGDEVQLTCNHSNTNYDMILWYQQSEQNPALKLIGYVRFTKATMEDPFKEHFNMSGDVSAGKTVYLHIPKLRGSEDTAVYFCAASYAQCLTTPSLLYKNPL